MGIEILGPQDWKQDYKVLYKNVSKHPLHYVKLTPRVKEVQRNLSVYNSKGNRLAVLSSIYLLLHESMIKHHNVTRVT